MLKNIITPLPLPIKYLIGELFSLLLFPFKKYSKIYTLYKRIKHAIGWYRVIDKGDIVIQGVVDYTYPPSFIEPMSKAVGNKGLVIGIEPSEDNINFVNNKIKKNLLHNNIILVKKPLVIRKDYHP